jgi:hypothetical protein
MDGAPLFVVIDAFWKATAGLGSCSPRSQKRDLGHPAVSSPYIERDAGVFSKNLGVRKSCSVCRSGLGGVGFGDQGDVGGLEVCDGGAEAGGQLVGLAEVHALGGDGFANG